ncbi:hypothetical protein AMJ85_11950 [candidate division BRC1 bacterium SM23_51]|nr:MAG: hypothetical protein AMJ85_11950 [candidate division BRC1 bacterium SM23_51]
MRLDDLAGELSIGCYINLNDTLNVNHALGAVANITHNSPSDKTGIRTWHSMPNWMLNLILLDFIEAPFQSF